jgi:hypothetical protein
MFKANTLEISFSIPVIYPSVEFFLVYLILTMLYGTISMMGTAILLDGPKNIWRKPIRWSTALCLLPFVVCGGWIWLLHAHTKWSLNRLKRRFCKSL